MTKEMTSCVRVNVSDQAQVFFTEKQYQLGERKRYPISSFENAFVSGSSNSFKCCFFVQDNNSGQAKVKLVVLDHKENCKYESLPRST